MAPSRCGVWDVRAELSGDSVSETVAAASHSRARAQVSSSSSTSPPMMSVTSSSPSSSSSMKVSSSSIVFDLDYHPRPRRRHPLSPPFLPSVSASASSSETNSASAVSGTSALSARLRLRRRGRASARARVDTDRLEHRLAFRAHDRSLCRDRRICAPQLRTQPLGAQVGFCHVNSSSRWKIRPSLGQLRSPLSIAGCRKGRSARPGDVRPAGCYDALANPRIPSCQLLRRDHRGQ